MDDAVSCPGRMLTVGDATGRCRGGWQGHPVTVARQVGLLMVHMRRSSTCAARHGLATAVVIVIVAAVGGERALW
jgi:hypothetical protein